MIKWGVDLLYSNNHNSALQKCEDLSPAAWWALSLHQATAQKAQMNDREVIRLSVYIACPCWQ